jgi:hypothetical protein
MVLSKEVRGMPSIDPMARILPEPAHAGIDPNQFK